LPDFTNLPKPTTSVQLFDNSIKTVELTQQFSVDGAKIIILLQKASHQDAGSRTITSEDLTGTADAMIDNNLSSSSGETGGVGFTKTIVIDFGSIAVRTINTKCNTGNSTNSSGGGSASASVAYSTDNVSYAGGGTVCASGGSPSSGNLASGTRQDVGVNMRYAKITLFYSGESGGSVGGSAFCSECWDYNTGLGTSVLKIQIKNPDSGEWVDYITASNFATQSSDTGTTDLVNLSKTLPFDSNIVRAVLTPSGGVNTMVTILRIF
jgi:hypothetical protein